MDSLYLSAKDYDEQYSDFALDIPFYTGLAREYSQNTPILEFACGTLRLTLPLALAGLTVVGVDLSEEMLSGARVKLAREQRDVQQQISLFQGDMCSFKSDAAHKFLFVGFNSFLQLIGSEKQIQALRNVRENLAEGGHALIDIYNPEFTSLAHEAQRHPSPVFMKRVELDNEQVMIRHVTRRYYPATQKIDWMFLVEVYNQRTGELMRKYFSEMHLQIIFPNEWRNLLISAGFKIVHEWGNFDRSPFQDNSPKMLFLVQKL